MNNSYENLCAFLYTLGNLFSASEYSKLLCLFNMVITISSPPAQVSKSKIRNLGQKWESMLE